VAAIICAATLLIASRSVALAQQDQTLTPSGAANGETQLISADELDSLVAPIALYPDALLAQTLAASTYPLEVIQLDQWMVNNKYLKDQALAYAVAQQPWDPSVQAMAAFPDVVNRMANNIQWTTDLGNAFLAQQSDVMDAVQRMRAKAQGTGNLSTNTQQIVETQTEDGGNQVITIEQPNPDTVYVPSYDPQMVYGPAPASYPYYPYTYPGYYGGMGLMFGTGVVLGATWANNWGNCDWKHGNVNINNNNSFNRTTNRNVNKNVNRGTGAGQANAWQHNPQHRGNAPYASSQTANRYGGTARVQGGALGVSARSPGSNISGGRVPGGGGQNIGSGNRLSARSAAGNIVSGNRTSGGAPVGAVRPGSGGGAMPMNRSAGTNSIRTRNVSPGGGFGSSSNAFGSGGFAGNSAHYASSRGGTSMGSGGFSRAGSGGGRAAGGRGGGGGGRR